MNQIVKNDIKRISDSKLNWDKLDKKSILITGATGFIGSFLVQSILEAWKNIRA